MLFNFQNIEEVIELLDKLTSSEKLELAKRIYIGRNQFDFIDYDEFCHQVSAVVRQNKINGIINCCSGRPERIGDRVERFIKDNGYLIKLKYGAFPERSYDSKAIWGNSKKIEAIIEVIRRENV